MSTYDRFLIELDKLERWSPDFSDELWELSRFIRNKVWPAANDDVILCVLVLVNLVFLTFDCSMDAIDAYIDTLKSVSVKRISPSLAHSFDITHEKIQRGAAKRLIERQWEDISRASGDAEPFIHVFDTYYNQCVLKYPQLYIVRSFERAYSYRACDDINADRNRFIPWLNKAQNRWNPPGKTYLYLSYGIEDLLEDGKPYTVNQHTCMEELRGNEGTQYAICRFQTKANLKVIDLSYNNVEFGELSRPMDEAYSMVMDHLQNEWIPAALKDKKLVKQHKSNPKKFSKILNQVIHEECNKVNLAERCYDSIGKQYLKIICDTVFKPIDDSTDKESQYHSFHELAQYLEARGFDGIIYPSTRMILKGTKSKNLVLFDISSAAPMIETKTIVTL